MIPNDITINDLPIQDYNYQIDNEKDCDPLFAYWHEGHNKCYEIYRQEKVDGTLRNEYTNQEDCENDGYGKWLSDKNICLKININKSDCLLSGGNWEPTLKLDNSRDITICTNETLFFEKYFRILNEKKPPEYTKQSLEELEKLIMDDIKSEEEISIEKCKSSIELNENEISYNFL